MVLFRNRGSGPRSARKFAFRAIVAGLFSVSAVFFLYVLLFSEVPHADEKLSELNEVTDLVPSLPRKRRNESHVQTGTGSFPRVSVSHELDGDCAEAFGFDYSLLEVTDFCYFEKGENFVQRRSRVSCWENPELKSSVCWMGSVRIDRSEILCSKGGETIESVFRRDDKDEFPKYSESAFTVFGCELSSLAAYLKKDREYFPIHLNEIFRSLRSNSEEWSSDDCEAVISEPTFFVTRYEYANLYHVSTDWYNVFQAIEFFAPNVRRKIVWLDGHSYSLLDEAWEDMFEAETLRLSDLKEKTCFENAVFLQPAYRGGLDLHIERPSPCGRQGWVKEFGRIVPLRFFGESPATPPVLSSKAEVLPPTEGPDPSQPRVTLLLRSDYLAHPRNPSGRGTRKLKNPELFVGALRNSGKFFVRAVHFAHISFREQLALIQNTDILVGVHGAGLSHVLFLPDSAGLIELSVAGQYHFQNYCRWKGLAVCDMVGVAGGEFVSVASSQVATAVENAAKRLQQQHPEWAQM